MKSYKDYTKQYIGASDFASLTLRSPAGAAALNFGEDNIYTAYIVPEKIEIPEHYKEVYRAGAWLKIYDDTELVKTYEAEQIIVYRAGERGCIIKLMGEDFE